MIYLLHQWSGQTVALSYGERWKGIGGMGSRAPYGYGPHQPGWPVDPQDASTWPSDGRTRTYVPEPLYPSQPLYPPVPIAPIAPKPQPRVIYVVQQTPSTPVIVEVIGGLFGFYGIGWLVSGYVATGTLLLLGSLLLAGLWAIVTIATVGVGLFCIIPIDLAILISSTLTLNSRLKRKMMGRLRRQMTA
jgi:hypothetical protein